MACCEGFANKTWASVGARLTELIDHVADLATNAVEQRVAACVLRIVNQTGGKVEGGIENAFLVKRADIAEMTGTSLHAVIRLLAAWEKDGINESRRMHIVVTQPHKLMRLSGVAG